MTGTASALLAASNLFHSHVVCKKIINMGIAEIVGIEMMPSITEAQIPLFPAAEKQKYTNEVNSFGRSGISVQCDSFFSGPRSRGCFDSNNVKKQKQHGNALTQCWPGISGNGESSRSCRNKLYGMKRQRNNCGGDERFFFFPSMIATRFLKK